MLTGLHKEAILDKTRAVLHIFELKISPFHHLKIEFVENVPILAFA